MTVLTKPQKRLTRRRRVCSRCGQTGSELQIHDHRTKRWRHLDLGATRCVIEASVLEGSGHIKAGKLRPLAVTGSKRSPQLPDVPTMAEAGVPGYEAYVWMGLLAPRGTPPAIVERLNREVIDVLATAEVKGHMDGAGIEIVGSTPAEFGSFFHAEKNRWAKVIKETGAKVD